MTSQRLNLNSKAIKGEPVGEDFPGTHFSWDPKTRILDIFHDGVPQQTTLHKAAVAALVRLEGRALKVIPLKPPQHPVALVAFNFNFFKGRRAPSLEEAAAAVTLAAHEGDLPPLFIQCTNAVFVFAQRSKGTGRKLIPFRWAAVKGADPIEIAKRLGAL